MGNGEAIAQLRGGLSVLLPGGFGWLLFFIVLSMIVTQFARVYAIRRDLLDHPGDRRSHATPTPRGGGIGIVLVMLLAMLIAALQVPDLRVPMSIASAGLLLVAGIGWWDDHRPLPPWSRLAVHAVAAGLLALLAYGANGSVLSSIAAFLLAIALINIWNFMDGIDGIAATQAIVVAIAVALLNHESLVAWLSLALVAASLGFLPFNLVRARIFLGDVGSGALGYVLAMLIAMVAISFRTHEWQMWALLMMPPAAFILDASLTLILRIVRGDRWWTPHVGHAYQRYARRAGRHWPVMLGYALWAIAGTILMIFSDNRHLTFIIVGLVAWYLGGGILWLWIQSRTGKGLPGN